MTAQAYTQNFIFIFSALQKSESDVFDLKSKHEEELMAKNSEIELLESDLERANQVFKARTNVSTRRCPS